MPLSELFITTGIAAAAFAATNIDDLLILAAFFADPGFRPREVVVGQYLGIAAISFLSLALARLAGAALPAGTLRFLGLVPLALGARALWLSMRPHRRGAERPAKAPRAARASRVLSVAAVTLANGGDNVGVYVPLFSTRATLVDAWMIGVFLVLTALWCGTGYLLASHPGPGRPVRRLGRVALPWVLMALGAGILLGHSGSRNPLPPRPTHEKVGGSSTIGRGVYS